MELQHLHVPDSVRESAAFVVERARDVHINDAALVSLKQPVLDRLAKGSDSVEDGFGTTGTLDGDINLVFFETAANFCFWAQDPGDKWKTAYKGTEVGGWYGLSRAFYKAVQNRVPVHDARFMAGLTLAKAGELFMGAAGRQIPLLEARVNNIVETARFLLDEHAGSAHAFITACGLSAPRIAEAVVQKLPSYRDGGWYDGRWIWLLKRAQILSSDLAQLTQKYPDFQITGIEQLTAFADYQLPKVLQHYVVLEYSEDLKGRIAQRNLIPSHSAFEIEIRAATIAACDKLRTVCELNAAEVDLALWLLSQDMRDNPIALPHHLTISTYY